MATHSNILAWRISWTEEPDGLPSMALQNRSDMTSVAEHACTYTHIHIYTHIYTQRYRHVYLVPLVLWFDCFRLYLKLSVPWKQQIPWPDILFWWCQGADEMSEGLRGVCGLLSHLPSHLSNRTHPLQKPPPTPVSEVGIPSTQSKIIYFSSI